MTKVNRLSTGEGSKWRDAVGLLVPESDREGELLTVEHAEQSLADTRCYLLIAENEEEILGVLSGFRFPDVERGGTIVYLYDIEVSKNHRRQGIGKLLIQKLLTLCKADKVDLVWAGTEANNYAARATFESMGALLDSDSYTEYEWELEP